MNTPVISILLDGIEPHWLYEQIKAGHLPTLARLQKESACYPLHGLSPFQGELAQVAFLSATHPAKLGYWGTFGYDPLTSQPKFLRSYDYNEVRPFYDYNANLRVCQFDLPKAGLAQYSKGIQILNWGAHGSLNESISRPPDKFKEIESTFGLHPALENDHSEPWQHKALEELYEKLISGVKLRSRVHRELLREDHWDLFMVSYSEMHSAGHVLMHLDKPSHALNRSGENKNWQLAIVREIDSSISDLISLAPEGSAVNVFTTHGMAENNWDIVTSYFLPEFLHRMAFPERRKPPVGDLLPTLEGSDWWNNQVWEMTFGHSRPMPKMDEGFNWMPSTWYVNDWPKMSAFALPSFDEGMVRLNLEGRDAGGIVKLHNYDKALRIVANAIKSLQNERTGRPLVHRIFRTRGDPMDDGRHLPPADLIIEWTQEACDVAFSPLAGRIGPVPMKRTGGHTHNGFAWFKDRRMPAGNFPAATPFDLGPTLLDLIGVDLPNHFSGQSLLRDKSARPDQPLFEEFA